MISEKKYYQLFESNFFLISGKDRVDFLQGLTSNDIKKVSENNIIYSSILSPQGKFFFDFFITNYEGSLLVECCKSIREEFIERLSIYKLQSDINLQHKNDLKSYLLSIDRLDEIKKMNINEIKCFNDPRFEKEVLKIYCDEASFLTLKENLNLSLLTEKEYQYLRIKNTIPNFEYDSDKAKSTLLELRFDDLNGIDWEKGCYMGQELTARTKYRGTVKKKIFGLKVEGEIIDRSVYYKDKNIGEVKSFFDDYGIAILRINEVNECITVNEKLSCNGAALTPFVPKWSV